jgi:hypothetical protein
MTTPAEGPRLAEAYQRMAASCNILPVPELVQALQGWVLKGMRLLGFAAHQHASVLGIAPPTQLFGCVQHVKPQG